VEPTKIQRNDIFEALVAGGLNPAEIELVFADPSPRTALGRLIAKDKDYGAPIVLIKHKPSASNFHYSEHSDGHFDVSNLVEWATNVRTWMETPDLWEDFDGRLKP